MIQYSSQPEAITPTKEHLKTDQNIAFNMPTTQQIQQMSLNDLVSFQKSLTETMMVANQQISKLL